MEMKLNVLKFQKVKKCIFNYLTELYSNSLYIALLFWFQNVHYYVMPSNTMHICRSDAVSSLGSNFRNPALRGLTYCLRSTRADNRYNCKKVYDIFKYIR